MAKDVTVHRAENILNKYGIIAIYSIRLSQLGI